jgi:hypothetical protein
MISHYGDMLRRAAGSLGLLFLSAGPAFAQFSARDGYAPDGTYRVQVELTPYAWLPATSGTLSVGAGLRSREVNFDSGPPTIADLAHSLHGGFVGYGLLRYGPWSAELDFQWIDAFHKGTFQAGAAGPGGTVKDDISLYRVAPGLGYQVYSGEVAGVPTTVDARAGFSALIWDASARIEGSPFSGVSVSHSFVQPWLGFRASFYPWKDWRFELGAMGEGFGVDNGVWGWGASALVSYSINRWLDVTGGMRALASNGRGNESRVLRRSLDITAYGPLIGSPLSAACQKCLSWRSTRETPNMTLLRRSGTRIDSGCARPATPRPRTEPGRSPHSTPLGCTFANI